MKNTLITAFIIGLIASIAFIIFQPLFGLATLTSRHAEAYVSFGGYSEIAALILSWFVHINVSIAYAVISTVIFNFNHSLWVSSAQVIVLGWFTTLIATPANEWVVKLVNTSTFTPLSDLAPLNTAIGPKFWLHVMFFAFVVLGLCFKKVKIDKK